MNVRYRVELSQGKRSELTRPLSGGKHAARKLKRAQVLLAAGAGVSDEVIAGSLAVGGSTVYRTERRFVLGNLAAALHYDLGCIDLEQRTLQPTDNPFGLGVSPMS